MSASTSHAPEQAAAGRPVSASRRVFESLRREIIGAQREPGQLLLESDIAREHGVSKTPAREALQMLAAERLVTVIPHRGYYVSTVTFRDFREAMQLRMLVEPGLTALAAKRRSAELPTVLRQHLAAQFDPAATLAERLDAATAFHTACIEASGNTLASSVVATLFVDVTRLHHLSADAEAHQYSEAERLGHERIIEAIEAGDAEAARRAMHEHLAESNESMANSFMQAPV